MGQHKSYLTVSLPCAYVVAFSLPCPEDSASPVERQAKQRPRPGADRKCQRPFGATTPAAPPSAPRSGGALSAPNIYTADAASLGPLETGCTGGLPHLSRPR